MARGQCDGPERSVHPVVSSKILVHLREIASPGRRGAREGHPYREAPPGAAVGDRGRPRLVRAGSDSDRLSRGPGRRVAGALENGSGVDR